jgi:phage shock protein C
MLLNKLYRKKLNKILLGLCSGLSESLGINIWILRLVFIGITMIGGFGILIYILFSMSLSDKYASPFSRKYLGVCSYFSQKYHLDLSIIRLSTTLLIFTTGILPGLLVYLFLYLIIRLL